MDILHVTAFLALLLGWALEQYFYYARNGSGRWGRISKHGADFWHDGIMYLYPLAFGMDPVLWAGVVLVGSQLVQVGVNWGEGWSAFDKREEGTYEVFGVQVPKPRGRWRIAVLCLGLLIAGWRLW